MPIQSLLGNLQARTFYNFTRQLIPLSHYSYSFSLLCYLLMTLKSQMEETIDDAMEMKLKNSQGLLSHVFLRTEIVAVMVRSKGTRNNVYKINR